MRVLGERTTSGDVSSKLSEVGLKEVVMNDFGLGFWQEAAVVSILSPSEKK